MSKVMFPKAVSASVSSPTAETQTNAPPKTQEDGVASSSFTETDPLREFRLSAVSASAIKPVPKPGYACKLPDGRMGVVSGFDECGNVKVHALNPAKKIIEVVVKPVAEVSIPPTCTAGRPDVRQDAKTREGVRLFLANSSKEYPHLQGKMEHIEVVPKHTSRWMEFNCIANSLGIRDKFIFPMKTMREQDNFYKRHGYVAYDGMITPEMLQPQEGVEKILVYASTHEPTKPRHAAVQDADGLWNHKLGQGPHIRFLNPYDMIGEDAGVPMRLYVRERR